MKATPAETRARLQFMTWLRQTNPALFAEVRRRVADMPSGLGNAEPQKETAWWQKALNVITTAGSAYVGLRAQKEALKINLERAKANLPPIDVAESVSAAAPVVKTQIDLPPDVVEKITHSAGTNINKVLLVGGGLAIAALLLLKK